MLRWYPSGLLRVALELTLIPIGFLTILAVKCIFDARTPWTTGAWSGPGTSQDFWKLASILVLGWAVVALGWRGARQAFKVLIVAWHVAVIGALLAARSESGGLVLHGDAIGLIVSLELLGPAISVVALGCAITWIVRDAKRGDPKRTVSPLQKRNRLAALVAVITLILAGAAFSFDYDEFGSVTCAAAIVACHEVIRPLNPSEELRKAFLVEGSAPQ